MLNDGIHLIRLSLLLLIAGPAQTAAVAGDPDSVRDRLERALQAYDAESSAAKQQVLAAIEERVRLFARRGELDVVTALESEKRRYEEYGVLPNHPSLRPVVDRERAARQRRIDQVRLAYERAVREYTRNMNIEVAEAVRDEFERWLEEQLGWRKATLDPVGGAVGRLANGERAFGNRNYVWINVLAELNGWHFGQTRGGVAERLFIRVADPGYVWVAVWNDRGLVENDPGWELTDVRFNYTDRDASEMKVLRRWYDAGDYEIESVGWTGTILLIPPDR